MLTRYDKLPAAMQNEEVRLYYDMLAQKRAGLLAKRIFDIVISFLMLVLLSPLLVIVAVLIKIDSKGPVFFRQERYTRDLRKFRIFKFRSMINNADKQGPLVTVGEDKRVTKIGCLLRRTRIDEVPQLINILIGDMSYVGTRPEVEKYVLEYTDSMLATLLLPAGVTSRASMEFKDEAEMLDGARNADQVYIEEILPRKMKYNLQYLETFDFFDDLKIMFSTLFAVSK